MTRRKRFLLWLSLIVILFLIGGWVARLFWQEPAFLLVKENLDWLVPLFVVLVILLLVWQYLRVLCPNCRKSYALKQTGQMEGSWLDGYRDEFKCQHCGHTVWKQRPSGGHGG
jgi:hypothetical protein